jgi:hypothetical protein
MSHLSPERIAALLDEPATRDEQRHFEQCARCRADFVATRRIVEAAASERDRPVTPLVPWTQLSAALRDEGVLRSASAVVLAPTVVSSDVRSIETAPSAVRAPSRRWLRPAQAAAAAALLLTTGAIGGRTLALRSGASALPSSTMASLQSVGQASAQVAPVLQFRSADDARSTLHSAEQVYSDALLWLAANDSALAPGDLGESDAVAARYRERLEVLDAAMASARRALSEAPDDPVMNRYYLATLGAREVTLRRLTTVLPASQQVLEY